MKPYDDHHWQAVAEVYLEAKDCGDGTKAAVAETWGVSLSAAGNWIRQARGRGLLPPSTRSQARAPRSVTPRAPRSVTPPQPPSSSTSAIEPVLMPVWPDGGRAIGVGRTTMFNLIGSGQIETVKCGRKRMVSPDALRAFAARLTDR